MLAAMSDALAIPNDLAACQALIGELATTVSEQVQSLTKLQQENAELQLAYNTLLQWAYRRRSERYAEDPGQLKLDFGDTAEAADAAEGLAEAIAQAEIIIAEHKRRKTAKPKPRNEQLPEHLPRYEVEADVPEDVKHCEEHGERTVIGYDRIETLEFERPKLKVRVTKIPKFACKNEPACGVSEPPRPPGLVEGNRYDTSIAAEIITAKYGYHLPIYRQQDWFGGSGWMPGRSTLLNILQAAAELIQPLARFFRDEVLTGGISNADNIINDNISNRDFINDNYNGDNITADNIFNDNIFNDTISNAIPGGNIIGTDDTRVTLLLPADIPAPIPEDAKSKRIHDILSKARDAGKPSVTAHMWAYRGVLVPLNVFDFTVSRHRDGPDEFLLDSQFTGTLLADCYSGYQGITLAADGRIVRAACNAHARRKVFEARDGEPLLASALLAMYRQLYDVEDRARDMTAADRQTLREREARPVWERMRALLDSEAAARVLPKSTFADALNYIRRQWDALQVYLNDGRLPIDNNDVEQLMKQVALGRKNWLFIGSVAAGERAADLLTLVSSAIRHDLDVWAYIKDVLDRLLAGSTDYAALRPDRWGAEHPDFIRTYRQEERHDRADAKRTRRAQRRLHEAQRQPD